MEENEKTNMDVRLREIGNCVVIRIDGETVCLEKPLSYNETVAAIVRARYDVNSAESLAANYLATLSSEDINEKHSEHIAEWESYQAWREKAKAIARGFLNPDEKPLAE